MENRATCDRASLYRATSPLQTPVSKLQRSVYAPYFPIRPAFDSASGIRYFASNCPKPPRMHAIRYKAVLPSGGSNR